MVNIFDILIEVYYFIGGSVFIIFINCDKENGTGDDAKNY